MYPNPVADIATIQLMMTENTEGKIEICDLNGKVLKTVVNGTIEGSGNYILSLSDYSSGVYIIKLSSANGNFVTKVTK